MKRLAIWFAGAVCVTAAGAGSAFAQPTTPGAPRPTYSPYLNLARPGGTPALNYYGLVRPEQQFRQSIQNLQGAVATNQQAIGDLQTGVDGTPATGHPTQFLNYGGYFLNSGQPTGRGGLMGGTQSITRPGLSSQPPRRTR